MVNRNGLLAADLYQWKAMRKYYSTSSMFLLYKTISFGIFITAYFYQNISLHSTNIFAVIMFQ